MFIQSTADCHILGIHCNIRSQELFETAGCVECVASAVTRVFSGCKPIKGLTVITGVIQLIPPVLSSETLLYGFLGR